MNRSPFPRKKPEAVSGLPFATKPRACRHCGKLFVPAKPMVALCGPRCAYREVMAKEAARKAADRADTKRRKADAMPLRELKAAAQDAFNKFIRARDADRPCISCGVVNPPMKPGGQWDAGHYLGRGAYPELRFHEDNCHKQCKSCNGGSGKFSHKERTVNEKYKAELLNRIGQHRLDALHGPQPEFKPSREEVLAITAHYRAALRTLTASLANLEN